MNIKIESFLDATYLKPIELSGLSVKEDERNVFDLLNEAMTKKYKLVMIRPEYVEKAKSFLISNRSNVLVGTVIDFPKGSGGLETKLIEVEKAIENGADDLDFVIDYEGFKRGEIEKVQNEVKECNALCLKHHKTVKWIIETAALTDKEIIQLTVLIKNIVIRFFDEADYSKVFIKSSTGFFKTKNNLLNGANPHVITLMLENATPLFVKASGGIKTLEEALFYISKGVKRIGTSSAKEIVKSQEESIKSIY